MQQTVVSIWHYMVWSRHCGPIPQWCCMTIHLRRPKHWRLRFRMYFYRMVRSNRTFPPHSCTIPPFVVCVPVIICPPTNAWYPVSVTTILVYFTIVHDVTYTYRTHVSAYMHSKPRNMACLRTSNIQFEHWSKWTGKKYGLSQYYYVLTALLFFSSQFCYGCCTFRYVSECQKGLFWTIKHSGTNWHWWNKRNWQF